MRRAAASALAALLTLGGCGGAPEEAARRERRPLQGPLLSRSITLPTDEARFPEPGGALLNRNCLSCHSATMVLYQPPLTEAQWRAAVEKMRDAYRAPIADGDVAGIVAELVALDAPGGSRPVQ